MIKNTLTNSVPLICHFPGKSYKKRYSKNIFDYMVDHLYTNIEIPPELDIISFKTSSNESILERQLKQYNNFLCIQLNIKTKWEHINKLKALIQYIENSSGREHILYLDAYDVILNSNNLNRLSFHSDKIIFNAENNFYNTLNNSKYENLNINIKNYFNFLYPNTIYKYLNAGCFLGNKNIIVNYLCKILHLIEDDASILHGIKCDQTAIQLYEYFNYTNNHQANQSIVYLDNNCELFMCMNYLYPEHIELICK